jgi:hypothetical protein
LASTEASSRSRQDAMIVMVRMCIALDRVKNVYGLVWYASIKKAEVNHRDPLPPFVRSCR